MKPKTKTKGNPNNAVEEDMVDALDELSRYQDFLKMVPKKLQEALLRGASAKEIYEQFSQDAAARAVLIAMTEKDSSKALAAIKEVQDRALGKAVEKKETTHKFDALPDEELDAILTSEVESLDRLKQ